MPAMPTKIGRYRVLGELGRGAMGVVYRGLDETLDREVALKVLSAAHASDREARARFLREGRAAGRLQHPNIVTIFELGEHEGDPFMAMELLEGCDLQQAIHEGLRPDPRATLPIVLQVLAGLGHAHEHGIVHRDIKPSNVFLPRGLSAKITDFGIARLSTANVGPAMTGTGMVVGTPHYMSPEQVKGARVDARSDLFSTGLILFELVTGEKAYAGDSIVSVLFRIVQGPPDLGLIPRAPEWARLRAVLQRALAGEPGERHPDAASMAVELEDALRDLGGAAGHTADRAILRTPRGGTPRTEALSSLAAAQDWPAADTPAAGPTELGETCGTPKAQDTAWPAEIETTAPRPGTAVRPRSRAPLLLGGLAAVAALGTIGWWGWRALTPKPRLANASAALTVGLPEPARHEPSPGASASAARPLNTPPTARAAAEPTPAPSPILAASATRSETPRPVLAAKVPALHVAEREPALGVEERLARGDLLFEQGRFARALAEARAVLQREPGNAQARALVEDSEAAIAVETALKNAREAMKRGDRAAALGHVRNGLAVSATDSRLIALFRELQ
jgi:hypothetical protein